MGKNLTAILSLVLRTLLVRQCAAMPTYPMVQAVPAGQTGPLVGSASAYSDPRKVPFRGSSPRWQRQNITYDTIVN